MLDIKFLRENPDIVKQNIKNKFQDFKLPMVDEVIELDTERRRLIAEVEDLRGSRNKYSKQIGALMAQGKKEEAEEMKNKVTENSQKLTEDESKQAEIDERIRKIRIQKTRGIHNIYKS